MPRKPKTVLENEDSTVPEVAEVVNNSEESPAETKPRARKSKAATEETTTPVESTPDAAATPAPEPEATIVEPVVSEAAEPVAEESHAVLEELEAEDETPAVDYGNYGKADFILLLEAQLDSIKGNDVKAADFKRIDEALKEARNFFEQNKKAERKEALARYMTENESEEGFEFKNDAQTQRFEGLYRQIKEIKNHFFQDLEKSKERNLTVKTQLLQRLRILIDDEENNKTNAGSSWQEFTKIQGEWKDAGNIASPHNSTLWATYHALLDRYYSNRTIYNELKELDRKHNYKAKADLVVRVEAVAKTVEEGTEITREGIENVAALFEEYKEIGPAHKAEQEVLWKRMRAAMDVIYNKRRSQNEEQKQVFVQNYEEKSKVYETLVPFTTYQSSSINEWNATTKEVVAMQDQWNNLKGQMPREEGRELSRKFWAALKVFFANKSEFFKQLEGKREQNLAQKTQLCEFAEAIVTSGEDSSANTDKIIELQKQWKQIGQVPEKFKDSIYDRFKKACDGYFNQKRAKSQEIDKEFLDNLAVKEMLCGNIEAAAASGTGSIEALNEFKSQWSQVGFVPKKDMQAIGKRYIAAVNSYIASIGALSGKDKDRVKLKNEVEMASNDADASKNLVKKEGDIRRRITTVENDIAQLRNNIEFFARSKGSGADKLRADVDKKIAVAEQQLAELKQQLKIIRESN